VKNFLKWSKAGSGPKQEHGRYLSHLEASSFDPTSAELGVVAAAALVPLLTAQVRVVENEGES